jgi:serine/threonine-protein kinase
VADSLEGRYRLLGESHRGFIGVYYHGHDAVRDRAVTVKILPAEQASDPELKARIECEAKVLARITHPSVVTVFDLGYGSDGLPYLVMEPLRGFTLDRMPSPLMTLSRRVSVIASVLAGLAEAHRMGIVHRGITPASILIQDDGSVKIMDFSIARDTAASFFGTGNIIGTPDYMSPEQVLGHKVDGRSDVFSVGSTLYELLTGRRPFHSDNLMATFYKITHEAPDFDLIPTGPGYDELRSILEKALAKDLADRYQTAAEFGIALLQLRKKLG